MRKVLVLLLTLLLSCEAIAQEKSASKETKAAGFEGAHIAVSSALVIHSERLNIDFSVTRAESALLGIRSMMMTDDLAFSHSTRPKQYAAAGLLLFGLRRPTTQLDLALGPSYFFQSRTYTSGWRLYMSGDFRVMLFRDIIAAHIHISNEAGGLGISVGWMRK